MRIFFEYAFFYQYYAYFYLNIRFFSGCVFFLSMRIFPKIIRIFENAFFSRCVFFAYTYFIRISTKLYVFMRIFLALPRIIRFFSILKTGHHVIVRLYAGTYYEYDLFNGHNKKNQILCQFCHKNFCSNFL